MTDNISPTLTTLYEGWALYQSNLTNTLAPLTDEQLMLRAAADLRPIWALAAHVISARVWWFHEFLDEGDPALGPLVTWDNDGQPARSATELATALDQTWHLVHDCLQRWSAADLAETVRREVHGKERIFSRQWVVWHVLEHDLHHGGEISFSLGMHGLTGLDL